MLDKLLKKFGASSEIFDKLRLAPGVVSRSATVAVFALLLLIVVANNLNDKIGLLIIAVVAFLLFLIFFIGAMIYGIKNPSAALLEGAELVKWQKQELADKSLPNPPPTLAISDSKAPLASTLAIESQDKYMANARFLQIAFSFAGTPKIAALKPHLIKHLIGLGLPRTSGLFGLQLPLMTGTPG